jgi:hypothetical protein
VQALSEESFAAKVSGQRFASLPFWWDRIFKREAQYAAALPQAKGILGTPTGMPRQALNM